MHEKFAKRRDVQRAVKRASKALLKYVNSGGITYRVDHYSSLSLAVNVKVHGLRNCAPEIRAEKQEAWYEHHVHAFWEWDFDGDFIVPEWCRYQFPEFGSAGRSGGYFVFNSHESTRGARAAYEFGNVKARPLDSEKTVAAVEQALAGWDEVVDVDSEKTDAKDIVFALNEMAEFFECATEWVLAVKGMMKYRQECYEGKQYYALNEEVENENGYREFFDYEHCTMTIDGEKTKISWPQHARKFMDKHEHIPTDKHTKHTYTVAGEFLDPPQPGQSVLCRRGKFPVVAFELEVDTSEVPELLNPAITEAKRLLITGKS